MDQLILMRERTDQIINQHRLDLVDEFFTVDFVDHDGGVTRDRDGFKEHFQNLREAFPDLAFMVEHDQVNGDYVLQRVTVTGTHTGAFNGIPPTGRRVSFGGFDLFRLVDGKVAEHWAQFDSLGLLQQLGVIPPPDAGPLTVLATIARTIGRGIAARFLTTTATPKAATT